MSLLAQDVQLTRRVGAATLCALVAAIAFMLVIYDRIEWGRRVRIAVYFHQTGGLREGAAFVLAGRSIGSIESIARSPHGPRGSNPLDGDEGVVAIVALEARAVADLPSGGDIFVASRGLLSERYLELGPAPDPKARPYHEGEQILGRDPPTVDTVLRRTWVNLMITREFAEQLRPAFAQLRTEVKRLNDTLIDLVPDIASVAELVGEARGVSREVEQMRAALGGDAGRDKLDDTITLARATVAQGRAALAVLKEHVRTFSAAADALGDRVGTRGKAALQAAEVAIERIEAAAAKIDPMLAVVDDIASRLARGEGSIGRLSQDPEFPEDAKELGKILKRQPWKIIGRPAD